MSDSYTEVKSQVFALANQGWRVHPLKSKSKKPILGQWQEQATDDLEILDEWWDQHPRANVGVVMGEASGIIDIECDSPEAEELLAEIFAGYEPVTPTFTSTRGKHRLFKWTSDLPNSDKAHWKIGEIDFKIGGGGKGSYCVFPPSTHPSGSPYRWLIHPDQCEVAELPDEVMARITARLIEGDQYRDPSKTPRSNWRDKLGGVDEGERNNSAAEVIGGRLREVKKIDDQNEIASAWEFVRGWNTLLKPPLSEQELRTTFESILRREQAKRAGVERVGDFIAMLDDPGWRLVQRLSDPVEWKLYSPHWDGFVSLATRQLRKFDLLCDAVMEQRGYLIETFNKKHWEGWVDRKTGETFPGKLKHLSQEMQTEVASVEERSENRLAAIMWNDWFVDPPKRESCNERTFPVKLPDGNVWFSFETLDRLLSHGRRDYETKTLTRVLEKIGAKTKQPRIGPYRKQKSRRCLSEDGVEALRVMAMHGAEPETEAEAKQLADERSI